MHYPQMFKGCYTEAVLMCSNDLCFEHSKNKKNMIFFQQTLVIFTAVKTAIHVYFIGVFA